MIFGFFPAGCLLLVCIVDKRAAPEFNPNVHPMVLSDLEELLKLVHRKIFRVEDSPPFFAMEL